MSYLTTLMGGTYDLYCSQPTGGNQNVFAPASNNHFSSQFATQQFAMCPSRLIHKLKVPLDITGQGSESSLMHNRPFAVCG